MKNKELGREEMIQKLVDSDLEGITMGKSIKFLKRILYDGWKGYNEMSDLELQDAYQHREF
jgi:hypothetical protein